MTATAIPRSEKHLEILNSLPERVIFYRIIAWNDAIM
jgi:hypothetical protein